MGWGGGEFEIFFLTYFVKEENIDESAMISLNYKLRLTQGEIRKFDSGGCACVCVRGVGNLEKEMVVACLCV